MKYRIKHVTEYTYGLKVSQCYNEAHLIPRDTLTQKVMNSELHILPMVEDHSTRIDHFGNTVSYFEIHESHKKLIVTSNSQVDLFTDSRPTPPLLTVAQARELMQQGIDEETLLAQEYLLPSPYIYLDKSFETYAAQSLRDDAPLADAVNDLMDRIYKEFEYDPHFTDTATPLSTVLEHKRGVCQDFAHLAIACLRSIGIAARYVSGYLETLPPPGEIKLEGADESHAWFAVYLPQHGWIDYDPTNNLIPSDKHITLAWGRDYSDVSPLKGIIYGGGNHLLKVSVTVQNLDLRTQQQQQSQQ